MSSSASTKSGRVLVLRVGIPGFVISILLAILIGCGERSSSSDSQIHSTEPKKVTIQATVFPTPTQMTIISTPTVDANPSDKFIGTGGKTSGLFQLSKGRYRLLLDVRGNDRLLAPDTWKIELFRIPDDVVLLDRSGRGVSGRSSDEFLIEDASWKLWFRLNVGDDANWTVTLRRVGDLPKTTPAPQATVQMTEEPPKELRRKTTAASRPEPTGTPTTALTATPTPTLTPSPTPTPDPELPIHHEHIVESGESLVQIAERYGTTVSALIEANAIQDPSLIRPGQIINIPLNSRTSVPTLMPTAQPTLTPQTFQSCQDVPDSLIVVDTQGRRAVPRHLVPSAPDGDNDGFACGGQLGVAPSSEPADSPSTPKVRSGNRLDLASLGGAFPKRDGNLEVSVVDAWRTDTIGSRRMSSLTLVVVRLDIRSVADGNIDLDLATFELHNTGQTMKWEFDEHLTELAAQELSVSSISSIIRNRAIPFVVVFANVPTSETSLLFRFDSNQFWPGSIVFPLQTDQTADGSQSTSASAGQTQRIPGIGDTGASENWAITLIAQEKRSVIGRTRAQGQYRILTVKLRNIGRRTYPLNSHDFSLVTPSRIEYSISSDGSTALWGSSGPDVFLSIEEVQPGLSKDVRVVFDVPPGASGLTMDIQGILFALPD